MPKPTQETMTAIVERLRAAHPGATYELNWKTPEEMLVATTLAAQCTDERVNRVTKTLFQQYQSPKAFAEADRAELEERLKPTGFYRQKARAVQDICRALVERFDGKVPRSMEELTSIRGIARKTANVVLNCCFDLPTGIIVDTHVERVSPRMGLSSQKTPEKIEQDLMELVPKDSWTFFGPAMVLHGRYTCTAKEPKCAECPFLDLCPRIGVTEPLPATAKPASAQPAASKPAASKPAAPKAAASSSVKGAGQAGAVLLSDWVDELAGELDSPRVARLIDFVEEERSKREVFPPPGEVFTAFSLTPFSQVKAVILGQDPYHDVGQAHGLSFSVKPGIAPPPSLVNIFKELEADLGLKRPSHGCLEAWARQGVLLLNAVLTVVAHEPNSHKDKGWEQFTDAVIRRVSEGRDHVVFVLWGAYAQKKKALIDEGKHTVITGAHPSPLSARSGFFGSKPFSTVNAALRAKGQQEIDWRL